MDGRSMEAARLYRAQQISTMTPPDLVLLAYDTAIRAAETGRRGLLYQALKELIGSLDLSQGEIAGNLFRLYEYLVHQARKGEMDEVARFLRELRDVWGQALEAEETRRREEGPTDFSGQASRGAA